MPYYLIEEEYVGPNKKDASGNWVGDTWRAMHIYTEPGVTNMSHQPCTEGWLGTSNDWCRDAHGEYETLDEARAGAQRRGFTVDNRDDEECAVDPTYVESWILESAAKAQWDAETWLYGVTYPARDQSQVRIAELVITARTTDEELSEIADTIYAWAEEEGDIVLHGLEECLETWRNWCLVEEEDEA